MVQNPFNGIESGELGLMLSALIAFLGIHSMELKVVCSELILLFLLVNPFNGIESSSSYGLFTLNTMWNPFNGIERQNLSRVPVAREEHRIHSMELKDPPSQERVRRLIHRVNPFNGIESFNTGLLSLGLLPSESIQWN